MNNLKLKDKSHFLSSKIIFLVLGLTKSGGDRMISSASNYYAKNGGEVEIMMTKKSIPYYHLDDKVKLSLVKKRFNIFFTILLSPFSIKEKNYTLICSYYLTFYIAIIHKIFQFIGLKKRVKIFYFIQAPEHLHVYSKYKFLNLFKKYLASFAYIYPLDHIYASHYLEKSISDIKFSCLRKSLKKKIVIPYGIDLDKFAPKNIKKENQLRNLMVIRGKTWRKGFDIFENVIKKLEEIRPNYFKYLIVDPTDAKISLSNGNWEVYKPEDDKELALCYQEADIYLFTSRLEGFGLPPLEAMACGTLVISNFTKGCREYMIDKSNALICKKFEANEFVENIFKLINDKELSDKLISEGLKTARKRDLNTFCSEFFDFIYSN